MPESTTTTATTLLLESLRDERDEIVWAQFDARYRPIIYGFALRLGVTADDAADVAQQTLTDFIEGYRAGKYDRGRGGLGAWITGIARNRVGDLRRAKGRRRERRGESAMVSLPREAGMSRLWEAERQRALFADALKELRENTRLSAKSLCAFELAVLQGVPVETVAVECGMSVAEVYVVKNRVTKRLREIVSRLNDAYEEE